MVDQIIGRPIEIESMRFIILISLLIIQLNSYLLHTQTAIHTSFEAGEGYFVGNIHNISGWKLTSGTATVVTEPDFLYDGEQALRTAANASALQLEHIAYASNTTGLGWGEVVYADLYIKFISLPTANYAITGYDLASSSHRSFMVEFQPNSKIKIYDGSSGWTTQPVYYTNTWTRLSFRIDNGAGTYQMAIDGKTIDKIFVFREIRNSATTFDYHSIRFSMSSGNCNVATDKLYVGTNPIEDLSFSASDVYFTVNVQQPSFGTISLKPEKEKYLMNEEVIATLTLPSGCEFMGWTGDLVGVENPRTFRIQKNMTIGATVSDSNAPGMVRTVNNVTQFKDALSKINPGDTILVLDGTYNMGSIKITRSGTATRPIVIKSLNLLGAVFSGKSSFTLSYQNYVTYEGFGFDVEPVSSIIKMEGCSYVRITRNHFKMQKLPDEQSSKWITIGDLWENPVCNSHHNRIDHNLFDGKYDAGAWLIIDGSHGTVPDITKYDRIDHNIFRNNIPRVANEKETIRIGVSDLSLLNSYTLIENNLFENCDGDPEIISVKSCSNIVRNNTFQSCLGTLSLRHGHNSKVFGNFFFGKGKTADYNGSTIGCGGIRVYGMNHRIYNNYFEGLTGSKWDAAITITNGDVANNSTSLTSHFLPENIIFSHNTLVNNVSDIEIGFDNNGSYGRAPRNCQIINNLIESNLNPVVKSYSTASLAGVNFVNNMVHVTGTASVGLSAYTSEQIVLSNPLLVKTKCRAFESNSNNESFFELFKLSSGSPAINAAVSAENQEADFEGQARVGVWDVGADEFNTDAPVVNIPMSELTAGPTAVENYQTEVITNLNFNVIKSEQLNIYPNPVKGKAVLQLPFGFEPGTNYRIEIYSVIGLLSKVQQGKLNGNTIYFDVNKKGFLTGKLLLGNNILNFKFLSE